MMIRINVKRLKEALIEKRLTTTEFAKMTGLSTATIYNIFRNGGAQMRTLKRLEKKLKIDLVEVVEDEGAVVVGGE